MNKFALTGGAHQLPGHDAIVGGGIPINHGVARVEGLRVADVAGESFRPANVLRTDAGQTIGELLDSLAKSSEIWGTSRHDTLVGNSGDNHIYGLGGGDTMSGGLGKDTFVYQSMHDSPKVWDGDNNQHDVILDFEPGKDKIDLSAIDANVFKGRDQAFILADGAGLPDDGEIRQHYDPASNVTRLSLFDGQTDIVIDVVGNHQFTADDFVL